MRKGERDDFGRLNVTDDELLACAMGAMIAASLRRESIMRLLGCECWEADAFLEGAHADLARIRVLLSQSGAATQ